MCKRNLFLFGLSLALVMFSCKKDKEETIPNDPGAVPPTEKSVETIKGDLETNGEDLLGYMEDMNDLTGIQVLMNLADLASGEDQEVMKAVKEPMDILSGVKSNNPVAILDAISVDEDPFEDGAPSLADIMDEYGGVWNYDPELDDVVQASTSTTEIVLNFPGDAEDLETNNASITINNLSSTAVTNEMIAEGSVEFPTSAHMDLKYNGTELMSWDFTAAYTAEGYPTSVSSTLNIDDYSFSIELTHTPFSSLTNKESFKYQDQILIETFQAVGGNWSQENIENNIEEIQEYDYTYTEFHFENVFNNGNAYIQILNVKLIGYVNFKAVGDKMWELESQEEDETITEEEYYTELAATLNANAALGLVYVSPNEKICDFKAKAKEYTEEEYDWWLDDYVTNTYWDLGADLYFADGSVVDAETYFTEDLGSMLDDFMDFGDGFEY